MRETFPHCTTSGHRYRLLSTVALLLLGACSSPPPVRSLPPSAPSVQGSAAGPLRGDGRYVWSASMDRAARALRDALPSASADVSRTDDNRLWVLLRGENFEPGRGAVKPVAGPLLDRIASELSTLPQSEIRIVGHTDSRGTDSGNDALSVDRAASVRDWLVMRGVPPMRFAVAGRGSREPLASNETEAGRASNRRVEILIGEPATGATPR